MNRKRNEVPANERWKVEDLYPTPQMWEKDFEQIQEKKEFPRWPSLYSFKGKFKSISHIELSQFFEGYFSLQRKISKLHTYAHLRFDEDLGDDFYKKIFGMISVLHHDFQYEFSWIESELISLDQEEYKKILNNPSLRMYRFYLEKIFRMKPHILSSEQEELLALSGKIIEMPYKAFGALNNVDLRFSSVITEKGEKKELTHGNYLVYLRSADRVLRKSAFEELHRQYTQYANTFCELLQGQLQGHLFSASARKFKDCREAAIFPQAIDVQVYDCLIEIVHQHVSTLHKYMLLRKKILKIDELHPYDLSAPLVSEIDLKKTFQEACDLVVESVAPLGNEYSQILERGLLEEGWIDPFENKGKRSGAYSSGCYDSNPYILMNYHGTFQDVMTLAHEAGHSMHSYLSRKNQPYLYASYPIFVAEVASTFNEQLLLKTLKNRAKNKLEKAYIVCVEIDGIRTTIFRQTLFAEFELRLHRLVEKGVPLTPSILKEIYLELNRSYYGPDLILDSGIEAECFRIPHFYYDFYVYQYATGLSAAIALVEQVIVSAQARDRYLQFLQSGGSDYPLEVLRVAGVDLQEKFAVEAAMKKFALLVDELTDLLA